MNDAHPIDVRGINPEDRMERWHTAALLTHLNQSDARIQATKANITIWHETLTGIRFKDALDAAHYYFRTYDPKDTDKGTLTIGTLGHLVRERQARHERLEEARRPIEAPRSGGPPAHIAAQFAAYKQKYPKYLNT